MKYLCAAILLFLFCLLITYPYKEGTFVEAIGYILLNLCSVSAWVYMLVGERG